MEKKIILIGAGSTNFGVGTIGDIYKSKFIDSAVTHFFLICIYTSIFIVVYKTESPIESIRQKRI